MAILNNRQQLSDWCTDPIALQPSRIPVLVNPRPQSASRYLAHREPEFESLDFSASTEETSYEMQIHELMHARSASSTAYQRQIYPDVHSRSLSTNPHSRMTSAQSATSRYMASIMHGESIEDECEEELRLIGTGIGRVRESRVRLVELVQRLIDETRDILLEDAIEDATEAMEDELDQMEEDVSNLEADAFDLEDVIDYEIALDGGIANNNSLGIYEEMSEAYRNRENEGHNLASRHQHLLADLSRFGSKISLSAEEIGDQFMINYERELLVDDYGNDDVVTSIIESEKEGPRWAQFMDYNGNGKTQSSIRRNCMTNIDR